MWAVGTAKLRLDPEDSLLNRVGKRGRVMRFASAPFTKRAVVVLLGPAAVVFLMSWRPGVTQSFLSVQVDGLQLKVPADTPYFTWGGGRDDIFVPGVASGAIQTRFSRNIVNVEIVDPGVLIAFDDPSAGSHPLGRRSWPLLLANAYPLTDSTQLAVPIDSVRFATRLGRQVLTDLLHSERASSPGSGRLRSFPYVYALRKAWPEIRGRKSLVFRYREAHYVLVRDRDLTVDGKGWGYPEPRALPCTIRFYKDPTGDRFRWYLLRSRTYVVQQHHSNGAIRITLEKPLVTRVAARELFSERQADAPRFIRITTGHSEYDAGPTSQADLHVLPISGKFSGILATLTERDGTYSLHAASLKRGLLELEKGRDVAFKVYRYGPTIGVSYLVYLLLLALVMLYGSPGGSVPGLNRSHVSLYRIPRPVWICSALNGFMSFRLLFGFKSFLLYPYQVTDAYKSTVAALLLPFMATAIVLVADGLRSFSQSRPLVRGFAPALWFVAIPVAGFVGYQVAAVPLSLLVVWVVVSLAGLLLVIWSGICFLGPGYVVTLPKPILAFLDILRPAGWLNPRSGERRFIGAGVIIGFLVGARVVSAVLGHPESISIAGFSVRWSTVSLPIFLLGFSVVLGHVYRWAQQRRLPRLQNVVLGPTVLLLAIAFVGIGWLASDHGWVLYGSGLLLVTLVVVRRVSALQTVGVAVLAVLIILAVWRWMDGVDLMTADYSILRIVQVFRDVDGVGVSKAENLLAQLAQLSPYVAGLEHFLGNGYLQTPIDARLPDWVRSDGVPAVYLFADFGMAGLLTAGFLIGFLLIGIFGIHRGAVDPTSVFGNAKTGGGLITRIMGTAAMLTVVIVDIYMLLANLNLVPYTGKNVFGFGVVSISDVLETGFLWTVMIWAAVELDRPESAEDELAG